VKKYDKIKEMAVGIGFAYYKLNINNSIMRNPFQQFQIESIRIISNDGSKTTDTLKASIDLKNNKITLYNIDIDAITGDFIERDLPNNQIERYEILDISFTEKFMTFPAHFIFKIKKKDIIFK
jgi:hypothetical protein